MHAPEREARRRATLLFTEQFYYPDGWGGAQVLQDITIKLARAGYDVRIVCGSEQYAAVEGDPGAHPATEGITILRVPRLFAGAAHSRKLLRQLWFQLAALPLAWLRPRPTLYVTQTNPPLIVPLMALVARARGAPLVIIAQDLYPELVIAHGMMGAHSPQARLLNRVFRWGYQQATAVVSLGSAMTERLLAKGVAAERITEIPNWAAGSDDVVRGDANRLRREWDLEGKFVLLYSGNLGVAHDIETPILALRQAIARQPNLRLVIVGQGVRFPEAKALVEQHGLQGYVQFHPLVPTAMLPLSIGLADVALVTLRPAFVGLVVPSKLLGYMMRGIPTIYVGPPSENATVLLDSGGGATFANGDAETLARDLTKMASEPASLQAMGAAARRYYQEHLTRDASLQRYLQVIDSLTRDRPSPVASGGG